MTDMPHRDTWVRRRHVIPTPMRQFHQQYLAKNPHGYRCHSNTGVKFPAGV